MEWRWQQYVLAVSSVQTHFPEWLLSSRLRVVVGSDLANMVSAVVLTVMATLASSISRVEWL